MRVEIPFLGEAYASRWEPISTQECVNLYATLTPDASPALVHSPGLAPWAWLYRDKIIRGMHYFEDKVYAVIHDDLIEIADNGLWTLLDSGSLPTSGLISMADNGTQLIVVDGTDGWIWVSGTLSKIVDTDFNSSDTVQFMDGYFILGEIDSGRFFLSDLYSGMNYSPANFATAESSPDNLLRILVDHRELWLFGESSTEVWWHTGETFPFSRIPGSQMNIGLAAKESAATILNLVFWLGDDKLVYVAEGYTPRPISNAGVNHAIAGYETISDATAYCYQEEGSFFYVLTFPSAGATWAYEITTKSWSRRESHGHDRHLGSYYVEAFGRNLVSDYQDNSLIYDMSLGHYTDNNTTIIRKRSTTAFSEKGKYAFWGRVGIRCNPGDSAVGDDPQVILRYSDDGGRTWSNEIWQSFGKVGEYRTRVEFGPLGRSRERVYSVAFTHKGPVTLIEGYADVEVS